MQYLDGLRGIAAVQVVLFHYAGAFAPAMIRPGFLGYVMSGFSAVYLFFLMSGLVLTYSFERTPEAVGVGVGRRFVRLGIPLAAAAVVAGLLVAAFPSIGIIAAARAHSILATRLQVGPHHFTHVAADATGLTMVLGYATTSIFGPLRPFLPLQTASPDQALWSLHVELWGSFLVLALVYARAQSRRGYRVALIASAVLLGAHPLGLFLIGHVAAGLLAQPRMQALLARRSATVIGAGLLLAGVTACTHNQLPAIYALERVLMLGSIVPVQVFFTWSDELGAILVFFGVLLAVPVQRVLRTHVAVLLGRLSFPVYLLHRPIMLTLGAAVFVAALPYVGQDAAAILALLAGGAVTFGAAETFERYVDAPAVTLSRRLQTRAYALVPGN